MTMSLRVRKAALTAHVVVSVGWIGAVVTFAALAVAGLTSHDGQLVRSTDQAMSVIGWAVIVPLAFATLPTGVLMSLGTDWGVFRRNWVVAASTRSPTRPDFRWSAC